MTKKPIENKAEKLTIKQELYCQYRIYRKLSQRKAYIAAYGKSERASFADIDKRACKLEKTPKIVRRLAELVASLEKKAIWDRTRAVRHMIEIAEVARENAEIVVTSDKGEISSGFDSQMLKTSIEAAREASKLSGLYTDNINLTESIGVKALLEQIGGNKY